VSVYGSNNPYPDTGIFLRSTTTDAEGWYGLTVYDDDSYEYFHIQETDPPAYASVGATTVSGTVQTSNWQAARSLYERSCEIEGRRSRRAGIRVQRSW